MGANSKTSAATTVDRGELASLLAGCPWAEEYLSNVQSTNDAHCAQAGRRLRAGARRRRSLEGDPGQAVRVGEIEPVCQWRDDFAISTRTEAWTAVFRGADDDRVIAAAKKGAPTSWCAQRSKNKLASFSLKKSGSEKAHRLACEWTRRMQWMYDTYVTQDDEAFEYSDVHFASYLQAADWEAFFASHRLC